MPNQIYLQTAHSLSFCCHLAVQLRFVVELVTTHPPSFYTHQVTLHMRWSTVSNFLICTGADVNGGATTCIVKGKVRPVTGHEGP